jgi:hypothetical protein
VKAVLQRDAIVLVADVPDDLAAPPVAVRVTVAKPPALVDDGGTTSVTLPCADVDRGDGPARLSFPLGGAPAGVIVKAEIVALAGSDVVASPGVADMLACLFPVTDEEFRRVFDRRRLRWGDARSDHFLARQICLHFPGSPYSRCAAAPVLCYTAVELDDPGDLAEALEIASALIPVAESCRRHWHPRRNGEHLAISLSTAIWHIHLARADIAALVATLERMRAGMDRVSNYLSPSFNLCKSFLLYGYVLFCQGDHHGAKAMFRLVVETFKRGAADVDVRRVTLLNELGASHRAAVLAAKALHALDGGGAAVIDGDAILGEALRVDQNAGHRLAQRLHASLAS